MTNGDIARKLDDAGLAELLAITSMRNIVAFCEGASVFDSYQREKQYWLNLLQSENTVISEWLNRKGEHNDRTI